MIAVLLLALSLTANAADVFKCTDAAGKVIYADKPCVPSSTSTKIRIDAASNPNAAANLAAIKKEYADSLARSNEEAAARQAARAADAAAAQQAAYIAAQQQAADEQPTVVNNYYTTQVNKKVVVSAHPASAPSVVPRKRVGQ